MGATDGDATAFGDVEAATRGAIAELGELADVQKALAETAYRLARALDSGTKGMAISATAKELRETLTAIKEASDAGDAASQLEAFMSSAVGDGSY
ncbi:hypothetical protein [Actinoallomurus vinaceus]